METAGSGLPLTLFFTATLKMDRTARYLDFRLSLKFQNRCICGKLAGLGLKETPLQRYGDLRAFVSSSHYLVREQSQKTSIYTENGALLVLKSTLSL